MLGTRLAELRKEMGLSQAELAQKIHVSASCVGMHEQGRRMPGLDILLRLARIYGVSLDYLVSGEESSCSRGEKDESALPEKLVSIGENQFFREEIGRVKNHCRSPEIRFFSKDETV